MKGFTFKILPDSSEYNHYGKLSVIDRAIDPQTGTIRIRVVFRTRKEVSVRE